MMLALAVAASAFSPSRRPTQIELIVPFSVCKRLPISIGTENLSRVGRIGPCVRSPFIVGRGRSCCGVSDGAGEESVIAGLYVPRVSPER